MAIEIKGLDSLARKLQALGGNLQGALYRGVEKTVLKAEGDAKANAPSGRGSQADSSGSGSLRQSITHEVKDVGNGEEGRVFSNSDHAIFVEMGTGAPGAVSGGKSPNVGASYTTKDHWTYPIVIDSEQTFRVTSGQPARPYLYPAAVENKDSFVQNVENELREEIRKVARG